MFLFLFLLFFFLQCYYQSLGCRPPRSVCLLPKLTNGRRRTLLSKTYQQIHCVWQRGAVKSPTECFNPGGMPADLAVVWRRVWRRAGSVSAQAARSAALICTCRSDAGQPPLSSAATRGPTPVVVGSREAEFDGCHFQLQTARLLVTSTLRTICLDSFLFFYRRLPGCERKKCQSYNWQGV